MTNTVAQNVGVREMKQNLMTKTEDNLCGLRQIKEKSND